MTFATLCCTCTVDAGTGLSLGGLNLGQQQQQTGTGMGLKLGGGGLATGTQPTRPIGLGLGGGGGTLGGLNLAGMQKGVCMCVWMCVCGCVCVCVCEVFFSCRFKQKQSSSLHAMHKNMLLLLGVTLDLRPDLFTLELEDGMQTSVCKCQLCLVGGFQQMHLYITVKITAALDGSMLYQRSADRDVRIGITDGRVMNNYEIVDINNYPNWPPCYALSASGLRKTISSGPVPDQFTFLFKPAERFGACSTAQNGGYVNVDTFNNQLDLSLGISLRLSMQEADEDIRYNYFLVEIIQ